MEFGGLKMGQVNLSLEEYDQLKKQTDLVAQVRDCFSLERNYNGDEIKLNISISKAAEIFKAMFLESEYNDGSYEIQIINTQFDEIDVAGYYVKAVKKEDGHEESREDDE